MTLLETIHAAYDAALLPVRMHSREADVLLITTSLQEAPNGEQCQLPVRPGKCGPARGIFQFERGGGVAGVLRHPSSRPHVLRLCVALGIPATLDGLFDALPTQNDVLDVALARLLYWTDSAPLPPVGDVGGAWTYYLRCWRPGAYSRGTPQAQADLREKWGRNYDKALRMLGSDR